MYRTLAIDLPTILYISYNIRKLADNWYTKFIQMADNRYGWPIIGQSPHPTVSTLTSTLNTIISEVRLYRCCFTDY